MELLPRAVFALGITGHRDLGANPSTPVIAATLDARFSLGAAIAVAALYGLSVYVLADINRDTWKPRVFRAPSHGSGFQRDKSLRGPCSSLRTVRDDGGWLGEIAAHHSLCADELRPCCSRGRKTRRHHGGRVDRVEIRARESVGSRLSRSQIGAIMVPPATKPEGDFASAMRALDRPGGSIAR